MADQKKRYTAAERDAIASFLGGRLAMFRAGEARCKQMLAVADLPGIRNNLAYYQSCVACVLKMLSDLTQMRTVETASAE